MTMDLDTVQAKLYTRYPEGRLEEDASPLSRDSAALEGFIKVSIS